MKKNLLLIIVLASFLVAGCAHDKYVPRGHSDPSRPKVDVDIKTGVITVDPEILVFTPGTRSDVVIWSLPRDSTLEFPDSMKETEKGISIEGRLKDELLVEGPADGPQRKSVVLDTGQTEIFGCTVVPDSGRKQFSCQNRYSTYGVYKYTIRVRDVVSKKTFNRDPNWVNNPPPK